MKRVSRLIPNAAEERLRLQLWEERGLRALPLKEKGACMLLWLPVALLLALAALTICRELGAVHLLYTPLAVGMVLLLALLVWLLVGESRKWLWILLVGAIGLRVLFALAWTVYPHEVYLANWNLALELAAVGPSTWPALVEAAGYSGDLATELPHVLYMSLCLRLFGATPAAVQLLGTVWGGLSCLLTALVARRLTGSPRAGLLAGGLLACCPTLLFFAGVLSCQPLYTLLLLVGLWALLCRPFGCPLVNSGVAGAAWGLAQVLRPGLAVPLLVGALWLLLLLPGRREKKSLAVQAGCLLAVGLALWLLVGLTESQFFGVDIMDGRLSERLETGLCLETEGRYEWVRQGLGQEKSTPLGEILTRSLDNPGDSLRLLLRKTRFQFASYDYQWARMDRGIDLRNRIIDHVMQPFLQSYMLMVLLLALVGAGSALRRQIRGELLLCGLLLGYLLAALLLEVDSTYNACVIPLLTVFAAVPGLKAAEWTMLLAAGGEGGKGSDLPFWARTTRQIVSIVIYALMLALIWIFFTGEGIFIYEAF